MPTPETQKLFTKLEIQGIIKHITGLSKSKKGNPFIGGLIQVFNESNGKRSYYTTIPFIAFEDVAKQINGLGLQKDEVVFMRGSLNESTYKEQKQMQLVVSSVLGLESEIRYKYVDENQRNVQVDFDGNEPEPQKNEVKKENPFDKEKYSSNPFD